jgi:hypothetical protein
MGLVMSEASGKTCLLRSLAASHGMDALLLQRVSSITWITAIKPGGRVPLAGIPDNDRTLFLASLAHHKGLTIKLVHP